ncbi:MAG: N-acetyltransferase [Thaumarchaeota archaeon]|nr:N-acetyltransferase [Nitrososphaerota archaeon]
MEWCRCPPTATGGTSTLCVAPEYRRRGIASRLMDMVIGEAGQRMMTLDVKTDRPYLLKFYGSLGFERRRLSRDHYRDGSDRFILVRGGPKA